MTPAFLGLSESPGLSNHVGFIYYTELHTRAEICPENSANRSLDSAFSYLAVKDLRSTLQNCMFPL